MRSLLAVIVATLFLSTMAVADAPPTSPTNQAFKALAVTTSDTTDLPGGVTLGLYNGNSTACNITMTLQNDTGTAVTSGTLWANVASGFTIPARVKRVFATGTNCGNLLALYPSP